MMPIRKFRSVEEMNTPIWRRPGDPELVGAIRAVWEFGRRTSRRRFPPGVHKYASIDEMQAAQARWRDSDLDTRA
jgi:hypothetical protein